MAAEAVNLTEALASFDGVYSPRIVAQLNDYEGRGVRHKPSSPGGTILMFEPSGTSSTRTRHDDLPDHVDSTTGHRL